MLRIFVFCYKRSRKTLSVLIKEASCNIIILITFSFGRYTSSYILEGILMFEGSEVRQIKMLDKLESSYGKPSMDCVVMMNMESYKDLKHI